MVRVRSIFLLLSLSFVHVSQSYAAGFESKIFSTFRDSVVYIESEGYLYNGEIERTTGSGFIITYDGIVLTNNHVTFRNKHNYKSILYKVKVGSRRASIYREAKLIDHDIDNDLALLRITNFNATKPIRIINSDFTDQGVEVAVLGFQLSFDLSVAKGLVSTFVSPNRWLTDAPINMGSSGGPVFTELGDAIGIVSGGAISSYIEGLGDVPVEGIKFFVPSKMFLEHLAKRNAVVLAQLPPLQSLTSTNDIPFFAVTYPFDVTPEARVKLNSALQPGVLETFFGQGTTQTKIVDIQEISATPGFRFTNAGVVRLKGGASPDFVITLREGGEKARIAYVSKKKGDLTEDVFKNLAIIAEQASIK